METCFLFQDTGSGTAWLLTLPTELCLRTTSWSWLNPVNPVWSSKTFIYLSVDPRLLMPRNGSWSWSYINLSCVLISRQALILSLSIQSQSWSKPINRASSSLWTGIFVTYKHWHCSGTGNNPPKAAMKIHWTQCLRVITGIVGKTYPLKYGW